MYALRPYGISDEPIHDQPPKFLIDWQWSEFATAIDAAERHDSSNEQRTLFLPSFEIEFFKNLNIWLSKFGVNDIFTPGVADLSPMFPSKDDAFVSSIKHSATFLLNEDGILATAATIATISDKSGEMEGTSNHYVNTPFYFTLTAKNKNTGQDVPLFMGKVFDPRNNDEEIMRK